MASGFKGTYEFYALVPTEVSVNILRCISTLCPLENVSQGHPYRAYIPLTLKSRIPPGRRHAGSIRIMVQCWDDGDATRWRVLFEISGESMHG